MQSISQLSALEQEATIKNELTKTIISNLKKQAKRLLTLLSKYNSQKLSDGILAKIPNEIIFQDIEQYCDLLSKQFCSKIEQLNSQITKVRIDISKLNSEVKGRPQTNVSQRIEKFKIKMQQFQTQLQQIWREQHFLVLNYRMDIAAKELQRWTKALEANKINQEKIRENVGNLFK